MAERAKKALWALVGAFAACELIKDIEFLVVKTDHTVLGENVLCKLFMLLVIAFCLRRAGRRWSWLGFRRQGLARGAVFGLGLGIVTYGIAYGIEFLVLHSRGLAPHFAFYISNFSLAQQNVTGGSPAALVICLAGNVLNVWAEEGLFRGLLFRLGKRALSPRAANLAQALLFGLWHLVVVAVWVQEASMDVWAALAMAPGYVLLAAVLGYEWGVCALLTGTVWAGVFEHFFNNFVGNALHVVTQSGADELQILRIVLSNLLSLALVLCAAGAARKRAARAAETGR